MTEEPNKENPVSKAAALKYDGVNTPKLVAKGTGKLAQEIVSVAKQNDVHVHYDPLLLEVLSHLELGDEIPEELYLAVAKVIAFAYFLQGKHPTNYDPNSQDEKVSLSHLLDNEPAPSLEYNEDSPLLPESGSNVQLED